MRINIEKEQNNENIIDQFSIDGHVVSISPFGDGHINDTFRLTNADQTKPDYLLQRINHQVFKDVGGMMNNIWQVTNYIRYNNAEDFRQDTIKIIKSKNDELFVVEDGNYWRMFDFKKGTKTFEVVESPEQAYQGALAFGKFMRILSDFPAESLVETLPQFHNIILRLETLEAAILKDVKGRLKEVQPEIKYVRNIADQMSEIESLKIAGKIPLRVTHNDTKFNNVLLDEKDRGVCVIDLDTVMPGVVHYDFGDGIRTSTNTAEEDEPDLSLVNFDIQKFEAFANGFLEPTRDILTPIEMEYLGISGALLAYIMAVRFLTDYLQGDVYYKIKYSNTNLDRCRGQLELVRQILERQKDIRQMLGR